MTVQEFSNSFDVLYNNIMANAAPGLNEYEKSVFLTKAQEEIIKNYFNPKGNKYQEGFDNSSKRQIDFSSLISVKEATATTLSPIFDIRAKVYKLPEDLFLIINENITTNTGIKQVIALRYDEYTRLMSKPYKEPLKFQAWRLITTSEDNSTIQSEIISHSGETITKYTIRYIRKPKPIILCDLSSDYGNVSINGESSISECELNPSIHEEILQRAVELAKSVYIGDIKSTVELGQRTE